MKTLRVTLADIIGPTGTPNSTATVHARYVDTSGRGRDVHLTDGTIVVPVRRVAAPDGDPEVFDFDVYANDAAPVREVDYGHLVEVSWTVVAPTGAKSSGVKRVQITDSMASVVQLGLLSTPTPVPPYTGGYVLPGELDALDARVVVLEEAPGGGGGGGTSVHGDLTGRSVADQHPIGAIAGLQAALDAKADDLGADDNYVTDAEKAALHTHPAVIAQGATQADARTALGLGTAATTAATAYATAAQGTAADAALAAAAAPELIRDTMATALVAGANVTITPNDGADTITIAASGGGGGGGSGPGFAFVGPSLPSSFYGQYFPTSGVLDSVNTRGTSRAVPIGVPISGIVFSVGAATVTGTTISVGVYECDEIGHPTTRVHQTSGIAGTAGWKQILFGHVPLGGLLWVFFKPSQNDAAMTVNGYNNNSGDFYGVPRAYGTMEAQRSCYITGNNLPADASGTLAVDSDWGYQPGWHPYYNAVRPT